MTFFKECLISQLFQNAPEKSGTQYTETPKDRHPKTKTKNNGKIIMARHDGNRTKLKL
jgi:hypothetical protein